MDVTSTMLRKNVCYVSGAVCGAYTLLPSSGHRQHCSRFGCQGGKDMTGYGFRFLFRCCVYLSFNQYSRIIKNNKTIY